MESRGRIAGVVISAMVFASTVTAAAAPPIMTPFSCLTTGMNPRVVATVAPPLKSPRVFFRANAERSEYYVDMKRGSRPNEWVAILPQIEPSTTTVQYRVGAMDETNKWVLSAPVTITAKKSCAAGAALAAADQQSANNIVLGQTIAGQSEVPPGFSCRGIVSVIDYDCRLRPNEGCRRLLAQGRTGVPAAALASAAAGAGASGLSAALLAALAAAGLAAGLLIYNQTEGGSNEQGGSPSRP